jgi:hypothetical protein
MKQRALSNDQKITYPDICFVFNRNFIKVSGNCRKISLSITDGNKTYTDNRVDTSYADISPYLQMLFDRDEIVDGGNIKDIDVHVKASIIVGSQHGSPIIIDIEEDLEIKAIWGAMNIGEKLVGWKKARWFKNFPYDLSFYIPETTGYIFKGENGGNFFNMTDELPRGFAKIDKYFFHNPLPELRSSQLSFLRDKESYFDDSFDVTFWDKAWIQFQINIVFDDRSCGRYLRWVDRQGFMRYYLFQEISTTHTTEEKSSEFAIDYEDDEYAYYGASRTLGKKTTKTINAAATFLDKDEREYVQTLLSSPLVWEYIDEEWIPVSISAGTYTSPNDERKPLQHIEIQIKYPEIISQTL